MAPYVDYSRDVQTEIIKLEKLKNKQKGCAMKVALGFLLFLPAVLLLRTVVVDQILFFGNILYGPILILVGCRMIWRGFIDSEGKTARRVAEGLGVRTLHDEIEDCSIRIGELKRKVEWYEKMRRQQAEELLGAAGAEELLGADKKAEVPDWLLAGGTMPERWENPEKTGQDTPGTD